MCPRCEGPDFEARIVSGQQVKACATCDGVLLKTSNFQRFLKSRLAEVPARTATYVVPDQGPGVTCSECQWPMLHTGYLGGKKAFISRCEGCTVVWLDGTQLDSIALLWRDSQEQRAASDARMEDRYRESMRSRQTVKRGGLKRWTELVSD